MENDLSKYDIRCCDNLELMKEIKSDTIDLIYCDILYGTGRKFADYQDLKPIRSEIESHYIPRIKEMHRILKPTGSIYLQMDTRINHWMRIILDDIFGYNNFRAEIVWRYHVGGKGKTNYANKHDIIIYYTKSKKHTFDITDIKVPRTKEVLRRIKSKTKNATRSLDITRVVDDVWDDIQALNQMAKERVKYDTQKPKELVKRIIKASSKDGDLVADFYSGSFTTAEVCQELNRNFIGCDINPNAYEIGKKRVADFNKNFEPQTLFGNEM